MLFRFCILCSAFYVLCSEIRELQIDVVRLKSRYAETRAAVEKAAPQYVAAQERRRRMQQHRERAAAPAAPVHLTRREPGVMSQLLLARRNRVVAFVKEVVLQRADRTFGRHRFMHIERLPSRAPAIVEA